MGRLPLWRGMQESGQGWCHHSSGRGCESLVVWCGFLFLRQWVENSQACITGYTRLMLNHSVSVASWGWCFAHARTTGYLRLIRARPGWRRRTGHQAQLNAERLHDIKNQAQYKIWKSYINHIRRQGASCCTERHCTWDCTWLWFEDSWDAWFEDSWRLRCHLNIHETEGLLERTLAW